LFSTMKKHVISTSRAQTIDLAKHLAGYLFDGCVITLSGDLGAGKTTFTQGLGQGLGITRLISSPTFTIMKHYHGSLELIHIDAYRLEGLHQDLGLDERIGSEGVCVIEWPQQISDLIPAEHLAISISRLSEDRRNLTFESFGARYTALLEYIP
jgi:tRNA threonylcarbamoyladenosine biosynthesis protein TsaE